MKRNALMALVTTAVSAGVAFGHAHTHVGRNQNQTWGDADDNKLWFFSMPGTPGWPTWGNPLELVKQEGGLLDGYYVCEALDCWHSAHPAHGNWQLGGVDPNTLPTWQIGLERVSFDAGFMMIEEDTFEPVLTADGEVYTFPHLWMDDKYNEGGTLGAWGFHYHLMFIVGPEAEEGEFFTATFRARDVGSAGYLPSDNYVMTFVTVPEPMTSAILGVGCLAWFVRRRR